MSKLTPVTFLKAWRGYSAGETAGFTVEQAKTLIDSETAAPVGKAGAKPKAATKAADPAPVVQDSAELADDEKP